MTDPKIVPVDESIGKKKATEEPATSIFWMLTGGYALAVLIGSAVLGYFDPKRFPLEPYEWGDVLAGMFSPLAFLWLIYASLSQKAELSMQRAELNANNVTQDRQYAAMEKQAVALQEQIVYLRQQADAANAVAEQRQEEIRVWSVWYLNSLRELHDELIDYTAHLRRDNQFPLPPTQAASIYSIDHLKGVIHAEGGLARIHQLPPSKREQALDAIAAIVRSRRISANYGYRAKARDRIDAEDVAEFAKYVDREVANKAFIAGHQA